MLTLTALLLVGEKVVSIFSTFIKGSHSLIAERIVSSMLFSNSSPSCSNKTLYKFDPNVGFPNLSPGIVFNKLVILF